MRINTHDVPPPAGRTSQRLVGRDHLMNRMFGGTAETGTARDEEITDERRAVLNRLVYRYDVLQAAGLNREQLVGRDLMIARSGSGTCRIADAGEVVAEVERMSARAVAALQELLATLYPYNGFPRFGVAGEGGAEPTLPYLVPVGREALMARMFGRAA